MNASSSPPRAVEAPDLFRFVRPPSAPVRGAQHSLEFVLGDANGSTRTLPPNSARDPSPIGPGKGEQDAGHPRAGAAQDRRGRTIERRVSKRQVDRNPRGFDGNDD